MTLKKVTTYIDEDLLRSVKALAARNDVRIYEMFNEALRRYLNEIDALEPPLAGRSLAEALSDQWARRQPDTEEAAISVTLEALRETRGAASGREKEERLPPPTPGEVEEWERRRTERRQREDH